MSTVLAPLELNGIGTSRIESLSSYFLRLAYVHGVTAWQLARVVLNDSAYLHNAYGPRLEKGTLAPEMLISYSNQTACLVSRLERLTGQSDLKCGTLLALANNLCGNQSGAIFPTRRWCPVCYGDGDDLAPEPLHWSISLATRCPIHNVRLRHQCEQCGAPQKPWKTGISRRVCGKCGFSLATAISLPETLSPWEEWCDQQTARVVDYLADPANPPLHDEATKFFLEHSDVFHWNAPSGRLRSERLKPRATIRPRLQTLFRIAGAYGSSPLDILRTPREAATKPLFEANVTLPTHSPKRRFNAENYIRCEDELRVLLSSHPRHLLPPLVTICKGNRVSVSNFYTKKGELVRMYGDEARRRILRYQVLRRRLAVLRSKALMARATNARGTLSKKTLVTILVEEESFSKKLALFAVSETLKREKRSS